MTIQTNSWLDAPWIAWTKLYGHRYSEAAAVPREVAPDRVQEWAIPHSLSVDSIPEPDKAVSGQPVPIATSCTGFSGRPDNSGMGCEFSRK